MGDGLPALAILSAYWDRLPFDRPHPRNVRPDPGHYVGKGRPRETTAEDARAKRKRVAKRRRRKGYA